MNVSPIGLQSLVGEELYLLNLHAVRLLVDAQKAFEIPFFFFAFCPLLSNPSQTLPPNKSS